MIFLLFSIGLAATTASTTSRPVPSKQDIRISNGTAIQNTNVVLPRLVQFTKPEYTDEARQREIEGTVTVQAEFDVDGGFKVLRIVKRLGHGLDESALAALKNWRFTPAYRSGQRVSVVTLIDINFILFDDPKWYREKIQESELKARDYRIESKRWNIERHVEIFPDASRD